MNGGSIIASPASPAKVKFEFQKFIKMKRIHLFSRYNLEHLELKNRIVMAPMTRSRAVGNIPNEIMAEYYGQRSAAGLIITEGTSPSPNGLGYSRIPGIYNEVQIEGWQKVTDEVHARGGKIFLQLMHTGRASHQDNLPDCARVLAPSAIAIKGDIWTDTHGLQNFSMPEAMTLAEIMDAENEFVKGAKNAMEAGFDGVELHASNGYLINQFLNPNSNIRDDIYGGNIRNRSRFLLNIVEQISNAIGSEKIGVKLSPYNTYNDMFLYPDHDDIYEFIAANLNEMEIAYLHLVENYVPELPQAYNKLAKRIRQIFKSTLITNGGYTGRRAESALNADKADLISFGRPFIANPDLPERLMHGLPLAAGDPATFYSPGEKGYTDYASYKMVTAN